jgi:hypothetical protein
VHQALCRETMVTKSPASVAAVVIRTRGTPFSRFSACERLRSCYTYLPIMQGKQKATFVE